MKILIVDDHPVVRKGLRSILEESEGIKVCGEAEEGNVALKIIKEQKPDLAIIDIQLKGNINGIELVRAIKERYPRVNTLVMSVDDGSLYAERAIRAGARGYIAKEEAAGEILKAIDAICRGKMYLSSDVSNFIAGKYIVGAPSSPELAVSNLSDRELEIFQLIGRGYKRNEIAKKLNINVNTIESHRRKIREKLNLKDSAELTKTAVEWHSSMSMQ